MADTAAHRPDRAASPDGASFTRVKDLEARLRRIALIARVTDTAIVIPGTDVKLGLDAIVGAVPLAGDAVMACASAVLINEARQLGLPAPVIRQMVLNAGLDFAIGAIPFVGDLFDLVFRANERNLRLVEQHLGRLDGPLVDHGRPGRS